MRDDIGGRGSRWGRLKTFLAVVTVAFAVTLAVVVGNRLSEEALGVLAGAVCGVSAAIPTSLIMLAVSRRHGLSESGGTVPMRQQAGGQETGRAYPPVVVVSPGQMERSSRSPWHALPASLSAGSDRDFRIVGGAAIEEEVRYGYERGA